MTTETEMEKAACDVLKKEFDAVCIKLGNVYDRSWPDRSINLPDAWHFYIEFKMIGRSLSKLQAQRIDLLRNNGHAVYVCRSIDEAVWSTRHYFDVRDSVGLDWRRDVISVSDAECAGITDADLASHKWLHLI